MNQIETFFDTMAERWDAVCVHDPSHKSKATAKITAVAVEIIFTLHKL